MILEQPQKYLACFIFIISCDTFTVLSESSFSSQTRWPQVDLPYQRITRGSQPVTPPQTIQSTKLSPTCFILPCQGSPRSEKLFCSLFICAIISSLCYFLLPNTDFSGLKCLVLKFVMSVDLLDHFYLLLAYVHQLMYISLCTVDIQ